MLEKIKKIPKLVLDIFTHFQNDNVMKLSAALSYYTLFSIAPMILLFLTIIGYFYGKEALSGELYSQIKNLIGADAALQIQEMVQGVQLSDKKGMALIVGIFTLLFGATGVFAEIQDSLNLIWYLKPKPKSGIVKYLVNRLISFSLLISLGFIFLVSLLANTLLDALSNHLLYLFSDSTYILIGLNTLVVFIVLVLLFTVIYTVLPDGKISFHDTIVGAVVTSGLFMIGKYGIGLYIGQSTTITAFGAAGALVVILIWVYYSAIILFLGAEFTKIYSTYYGSGIKPASYTVLIKQEEVEATSIKTSNLIKKNTEQ